jgi:hypothetical protein
MRVAAFAGGGIYPESAAHSTMPIPVKLMIADPMPIAISV